MLNLIRFNSDIIKFNNSYFVMDRLTNYSSSSFIFNLYYNSFLDAGFKKSNSSRNSLANIVSFNGFFFNDIDNKEFCCLFLLTFLNIIIGFFPNVLFYYVDSYSTDLLFFINY